MEITHKSTDSGTRTTNKKDITRLETTCKNTLSGLKKMPKNKNRGVETVTRTLKWEWKQESRVLARKEI